MGAQDGLAVRMVAEMLAVEVFFEVATTRESFQAISIREMLVPKAKDALGGFAFDWESFRQVRRWRGGW